MRIVNFAPKICQKLSSFNSPIGPARILIDKKIKGDRVYTLSPIFYLLRFTAASISAISKAFKSPYIDVKYSLASLFNILNTALTVFSRAVF